MLHSIFYDCMFRDLSDLCCTGLIALEIDLTQCYPLYYKLCHQGNNMLSQDIDPQKACENLLQNPDFLRG